KQKVGQIRPTSQTYYLYLVVFVHKITRAEPTGIGFALTSVNPLHFSLNLFSFLLFCSWRWRVVDQGLGRVEKSSACQAFEAALKQADSGGFKSRQAVFANAILQRKRTIIGEKQKSSDP